MYVRVLYHDAVRGVWFVVGRSISLMVQVALPCMLFAPGACVATLRGGTNVDMAPPIDYMEGVRVLHALDCVSRVWYGCNVLCVMVEMTRRVRSNNDTHVYTPIMIHTHTYTHQ